MNDFTSVMHSFSGLGKRLESAFRKALYDYSMIEEHKIAVALSGGKDSLAMLKLLHAISGRGFPKLEIHAIFINGEFTCGASVFVEGLKNECNKLGVTFHTEYQEQQIETLSCYPCSRKRRSLLFKKAKSLGIKTIAFGHHRDDNIETLFLNLCHKAEFSALMPKIFMKEYDITIIRPLIYISEEEIIRFAKKDGFYRITCQCPFGQTSKRKDVKKLLIEMEKAFPNVRKNIAQAAKQYGSKKSLTP